MLLIALGPLGALLTFATFAFLIGTGRPRSVTLRSLSARWRAVRGQAADTVGPVGAFFLLYGFGIFVMLSVGVAIGEVLERMESQVDRPAFRWIRDVQVDGWAEPMRWIGKMGDLVQTRSVAVVAAIALAVAMRRRWWVPPLLIGTTVLVQKFGQTMLAKVVNRGHPPTTLGTYPSGGVMRTIVIYGVIVFLILACLRASRLVYALAWGLIAMLGYVEGYTRMYLNKHWLTDVLGAWVLGAVMLALTVYAARALLPDRPGGRPGTGVPRHGRSRGAMVTSS